MADEILLDLEHVLQGGEGHLQVHLGELRLPVSPQIFISEAFCQLEVAVHLAHHQKLFEQLGALGEGKETATLGGGAEWGEVRGDLFSHLLIHQENVVMRGKWVWG